MKLGKYESRIIGLTESDQKLPSIFTKIQIQFTFSLIPSDIKPAKREIIPTLNEFARKFRPRGVWHSGKTIHFNPMPTFFTFVALMKDIC